MYSHNLKTNIVVPNKHKCGVMVFKAEEFRLLQLTGLGHCSGLYPPLPLLFLFLHFMKALLLCSLLTISERVIVVAVGEKYAKPCMVSAPIYVTLAFEPLVSKYLLP